MLFLSALLDQRRSLWDVSYPLLLDGLSEDLLNGCTQSIDYYYFHHYTDCKTIGEESANRQHTINISRGELEGFE